MQHYTSIEQSKKLIELGLKPESADMYYDLFNGEKYPQLVILNLIDEHWVQLYPEVLMPCWSLGALIKLMPKTISIPIDERSAYFYDLEWQFANDNSLRYIATNRGKCLIDIYSDHDIGSKSFIETAVEMIIWLLNNKML